MGSAVLIINLIGGLIGTLGPVGFDLALKIKALIEQSNLGTVDIKAVTDAAVTADDATMASVNQWLTANGFDPLTTV